MSDNFRYKMEQIIQNTTYQGKTGEISFTSSKQRDVGIYNIVGDLTIQNIGTWSVGNKVLELTRDVQFFSDFKREKQRLRIGLVEEPPFVLYDYKEQGLEECPGDGLVTCYSGHSNKPASKH